MDLPEIIGGKYRPRSVLGFGATGTVYCVEHAFTGDMLALKLMQPHLSASAEAIARFKGEARMAAKLRSRHVVRIFDADIARELGGAPYLVMELLEGSNLEQFVAEKAPPPEGVVSWLRQAAVPLDRAHRMGIVHRDLKLENLFLTKSDDGAAILKILDFGIARIAESPGMTKSGQLFGTPLYMAPEQARAVPEEVGPAADIFAIGLIAYKLLTGSDYRREAGLAQMLHEMLHEPLVPPSQRGHSLGDAFDAWFMRSCDPEPSGRFTSVTEQVEALAAALGIGDEAAPGPESPRWTPPPPSSIGRSSQSGSASRASAPPAAREPHPTASNGSPPSLRATTINREMAVSLQLQNIPTLSGADVEDVTRRPNGWRLGFLALCAVLLAVGVGTWVHGGPRAAPAVAAIPSGCPAVGGPATAAAPGEARPIEEARSSPPARETSLPASATPQQPAPLSPTTKASGTATRPPADAARTAMARTPSTAAAFPATTTRHSVDDDPLGDQK